MAQFTGTVYRVVSQQTVTNLGGVSRYFPDISIIRDATLADVPQVLSVIEYVRGGVASIAYCSETSAALFALANAGGGGGGGGGDASAANQVTGNTSLNNIDVNQGAKADTSATTDTGTFSVIALIKRLLSKTPALGSAVSASSQPVVIASDQAPFAVTVTGAGIPVALGRSAAAASQPVVLSNEDITDLLITGAATQTVVGNNVLNASTGTGATDIWGYRAFAVQLNSTGTAGTFIFEISNDNVNFLAIGVLDCSSFTPVYTQSAITASAANKMYIGATMARYIRIRIVTTITGGSLQAISNFTRTPISTGLAEVLVSSSNSAINVGSVTTAITPGSAAGNLGKAEDAASASGDVGVFSLGVRRDAPVVSASATGDYQELAVNKWGGLLISTYEKTAKTFTASGFVIAGTTATDIAILPGNATNTAYLCKIAISAIATAATPVPVSIIKRSTANTGGTTTGSPVGVPHDSSDAAAVSVPLAYTVNPTTLGTSVGNIRSFYLPAAAASGGLSPDIIEIDFGTPGDGKNPVLTGVTQGIAINIGGGVTAAGLVIGVAFTWIEI